jgi:hypothetical protein
MYLPAHEFGAQMIDHFALTLSAKKVSSLFPSPLPRDLSSLNSLCTSSHHNCPRSSRHASTS